MEPIEVYKIICGINDYYLGDTIQRKLHEAGKLTSIDIIDKPSMKEIKIDKETLAKINFIFILSNEILNYSNISKSIAELTESSTNAPFIIINEPITNYPDTWGKVIIIDATFGLNREILDTLLLSAKTPAGVILNLKEEKENKRKKEIEDKKIEQQIKTAKDQILKTRRKLAKQRNFIRTLFYNSPEEMILKGEMVSPDVKKGLEYLIGDGKPKDETRAFQLFTKAFNENPDDYLAEYYTGVCLYFNYGNLNESNNNDELITILSHACDKDIEQAIILLGSILISNPDTSPDGTIVFSRLADLNYPKAKYYLGIAKEFEGNIEEAMEIYYEAAEEGCPEAQNALGCLFAEGMGVNKNIETAIQWFDQAVKNNNREAKLNLNKLNKKDSKVGVNFNIGNPDAKKTDFSIDKVKEILSNNIQEIKNLDKDKVKLLAIKFKNGLINGSKEVLKKDQEIILDLYKKIESKFVKK